MKVYAVEVCVCDEYGCMEIYGLFKTKEAAHKAARAAGLQNKHEGDSYNYRLDYYRVTKHKIFKDEEEG